MPEKEWDGYTDRRVNRSLTTGDARFLSEALRDKSPRIFGFRIPEIVTVLSIMAAVWAFYIRTTDTILMLSELSKYTKGFMENSDGYHSAVTGTRFQQGMPSDPGYDVQSIRNNLLKK